MSFSVGTLIKHKRQADSWGIVVSRTITARGIIYYSIYWGDIKELVKTVSETTMINFCEAIYEAV